MAYVHLRRVIPYCRCIATHIGHGRGLVVTQDVRAGQLLLASQPLALISRPLFLGDDVGDDEVEEELDADLRQLQVLSCWPEPTVLHWMLI